MIRKIIQIDRDKCNGCGLCVTACHEGAIGMVDGKATLLRDDYCDGLGDCLPVCPTDAITFVEREAAAYDEAAVLANMAAQKTTSESGDILSTPGAIQPHVTTQKTTVGTSPSAHTHPHSAGGSTLELPTLPCGCPGTESRILTPPPGTPEPSPQASHPGVSDANPSRLTQWPVQIKLVPVHAPYFEGAKLLVAADCSAFAYGDFHNRFIKNHITLIGCPKLDEGDYSEKLTQIIQDNNIKSLTVVRMEVPCCGGLEKAAVRALKNSGKFIPWQVVTLTSDGKILES